MEDAAQKQQKRIMKDGTHTYQTHGVCARTITFTAKDGKIYDIQFNGGCNGNLKMISKLLDGMAAEEINAAYHEEAIKAQIVAAHTKLEYTKLHKNS